MNLIAAEELMTERKLLQRLTPEMFGHRHGTYIVNKLNKAGIVYVAELVISTRADLTGKGFGKTYFPIIQDALGRMGYALVGEQPPLHALQRAEIELAQRAGAAGMSLNAYLDASGRRLTPAIEQALTENPDTVQILLQQFAAVSEILGRDAALAIINRAPIVRAHLEAQLEAQLAAPLKLEGK